MQGSDNDAPLPKQRNNFSAASCPSTVPSRAVCFFRFILFIVVFFGTSSAIILTLFYQLYLTKPSYKTASSSNARYNFTFQTNNGLTSHITRDTSEYTRHILNYPSTGVSSIDSYIKQRALMNASWPQFVNYIPPTVPREAVSNIELTHTVFSKNQTTISIALHSHEKITAIYGSPYSDHFENNDTEYFTFDTHSGQRLSTQSLFDTSTAGMDVLVRTVRSILKNNYSVSDDISQKIITPDILHDFIIKDSQTISFIFNKQMLNIGLHGYVLVDVPIKQLSPYLQNPTARRFFSIPSRTPAAAPQSTQKQTCQQCIALTFDDGPGIYTETLLSTLEGHGDKATFFVIGKNVTRFAPTLQRAVRNGHQIGGHTWDHPELPKLTPEQIRDQLQRTQQMITSTTGITPSIIRPPYGSVDDKVYNELRTMNLSAILWSVDTRDWADRNAAIVCQRAVAGARPGAIILMHDIHRTSVEAVPCILSTLRKQKYRFVTINNLFGASLQPGVGYSKHY